MRTLLALACLGIAGCNSGQGEAHGQGVVKGTSVTIELPPPADKAAEPGFTISATGADR
jgi:hypothetical protein